MNVFYGHDLSGSMTKQHELIELFYGTGWSIEIRSFEVGPEPVTFWDTVMVSETRPFYADELSALGLKFPLSLSLQPPCPIAKAERNAS